MTKYQPITGRQIPAASGPRPHLALRASQDPETTSRTLTSYDVVTFGLLAAGVAFLIQSVLKQDGSSGFAGALYLGLAGVVAGIRPTGASTNQQANPTKPLPSISPETPEAWGAKHQKPDGTVSLWVEDDFNVSTRAVPSGIGSGEGPSRGNVAVHHVKLTDRDGKQWDLKVPEDRYVLYEAEDQGVNLPFACRNGCCTTCAVKVQKGLLVQDQALGIAPEFRQQGYGLMCVGYAKSDLELTLVNEDELYDKQFGESFSRSATNPRSSSVKRDDYALEIAMGDE